MSNLQFRTHESRPEGLHDNMVEKVFELLTPQPFNTTGSNAPFTSPTTNGFTIGSYADLTGKSVHLGIQFTAPGGAALDGQLTFPVLYPAQTQLFFSLDAAGALAPVATFLNTDGSLTSFGVVPAGSYFANISYGSAC